MRAVDGKQKIYLEWPNGMRQLYMINHFLDDTSTVLMYSLCLLCPLFCCILCVCCVSPLVLLCTSVGVSCIHCAYFSVCSVQYIWCPCPLCVMFAVSNVSAMSTVDTTDSIVSTVSACGNNFATSVNVLLEYSWI